MSQTPRTDALEFPQFDQGQDGDEIPYVVLASECRKFELELVDCMAAIQRLNGDLGASQTALRLAAGYVDELFAELGKLKACRP